MTTTVLEQFREVWTELSRDDAFGTARHTITFTAQGTRTYDTATGELSAGTPTTHTALGYFTQSRIDSFKSWEVGDTLFLVNQQELGYVPKINDRPVISGETYNVIEIQDDKAGGNAGGGVAYRILLRGG